MNAAANCRASLYSNCIILKIFSLEILELCQEGPKRKRDGGAENGGWSHTDSETNFQKYERSGCDGGQLTTLNEDFYGKLNPLGGLWLLSW